MESLVYDTASVIVEVKGGKVASAVTIASPTLTKKTGVPSSITAEYSSVENRVAVVSSTGAITISAGTDLSGIDGNDFTFNIKVIDSGGAYADFQETVTVNLTKVKSITFDTPPALTYGDAPQMLTAPVVDAANGASTAVTYSTSDPNVATVKAVDSGTGELTIVAAGEVTITAISTFDTSVTSEKTLTIAQKNINDLTNLTFDGLSVSASVGGSELSGAITVVSGLIGTDTMAEALSFVPIPTGPVQVDEDGSLTIPVQNNTDNHNKVYNITVNGKGNYTGSQVIHVTLSVLDSYFSYTGAISTIYGTEMQSPVPVWTNQPSGSIVYSLDGSPQGVSVNDANGVVTVGTAADVRTNAPITVKATVDGRKEFSASLTVTVTAIDIALVGGFSITVDNQTVPSLTASEFPVTIVTAGLIAGTDYDLSIEKDGAAVNGVTIDNNSGLVSIANTIDADDAGFYSVKATGKNNYFGVQTAYFELTVGSFFNIGDTGPAGGTIFYVNPNAASDRWTYLEAALQDLTAVQWGGFGTQLHTTGTGIGSGKTNTAAIVTKLGNSVDYAAKICSDYSVTHNGVDYNDWFLPSKDELNELYNQKDSVGGFVSDWYWSSSEGSAFTASRRKFGSGDESAGSSKDLNSYVRAVRAF